MASTSSSDQHNAFSGIEPPNKRRKVEESFRLFDVFINHRGPDVKQTLANQLYSSLEQLGIRAFLDSEEKELGTSFPSTIETAIHSASVHLAIFSKGYAHSPWCLTELVLMLQSRAKIIPLFYQVEPWELRHIEKGVYAGAFLKYEEKGRYTEKISEWKEALQSVSCTTGYEFKDPKLTQKKFSSSSSDCKEIVSAVEKEVQRTKHLYVAKHPVGLQKLVKGFERKCLRHLVQEFESQCGMSGAAKEKVNVVGISGMGGVGKTTLSKELFNQKRSEYTRACFLFDVAEASAKAELPSLQSTLLKELFDEDHRFRSLEEGTSCLKDRFERSGSLSFIICLDNIDHVQQLDALIAVDILNKYNNKLVIITTRDVGVLATAGIANVYQLKGLDREDGKELFCWYAFHQSHPCSGYEDLVETFVNKCGGLPLSLQVLGRHVSGKDPRYWREELKRVSKTLPTDVKKRLKISFDSLHNEEKQIFIDVACFFIGQSKNMAMTIWEGSGWCCHHALETLKDKCLLEEVYLRDRPFLDWKSKSGRDGVVFRMHDHLRDLGREMANELSNPRRVWHPQDLKSLELKGFHNILAQTKGRCFHSISDESMECQIIYFIREFEDSSDTPLLWLQLQYPNWPQDPLNSAIKTSIPSWIPLQNLLYLRINGGCFQRLWQSHMQAPSHLKELHIGKTFLEEFPDLSGKSNNMEKVVLHAKEFHMDIWSLLGSLGMNLHSLNVMGSELTGDLASSDTSDRTTFKSLVIYDFKLPWEMEVVLTNEGWSRTIMSGVESFEIKGRNLVTKILITGNCCQRLQSLKISKMEDLIEVDLARIRTLNFLEIADCKKLKRLSLTPDLSKLLELNTVFCSNLERVSGIPDLTKLICLYIKGCPELEELPSLARLSCLEQIEIHSCKKLENITLPMAATRLEKIETYSCKKLENIALPMAATRLSITSCRDLQRVDITKLTKLYIYNCSQLEELSSLSRVSCLEQIYIYFCKKLKNISFPTSVVDLDVQTCKDLQRVAGTGELTKLTRLIIAHCPKLEELPILPRVSCLKQIEISSCEMVRNITLPTTVIELCVQMCRDLQRIAGTGDLTKLTRLIIAHCPMLEELPSLCRVSCLEQIVIDSCGKLNNITLSTIVIKLSVQTCRDLQRVAGTGDLPKQYINDCSQLEELPSPSRASCLEKIEIDCCEKLENITLPTTLISLSARSCIGLQRVAATGDLTNLTRLIIAYCPKLEELPSLCRVSCMEQIVIDSCGKLKNITLPTTLTSLSARRCRDLQRVAVTGDLIMLTRMIIEECPELEELPSLCRVSCLEKIVIDSCGKLKNIILPATLVSLFVRRCRCLQRIVVTGDLTKLTLLYIEKCPELEELPSLCRVGCLEQIGISFCEKIETIELPTTLISVCVRSCRGLQRVAVAGDLTNLTQMIIAHCPNLEELPNLGRGSSLEKIEIDSCEKLENIILPKALISLSAQRCRDLQRVAVTGDLTKLTELIIAQCPKLEDLPSLCKVSCLEKIVIDSCGKLQKVPELHASEYMKLRYCSNTVIRNCIHNLKSVPQKMDMIGRAVDGAVLRFNQNMFCDANIGIDRVIEIGALEETYLPKRLELIAVIACFIVMVDGCPLVGDINESLSQYKDSSFDYHLNMTCQGEWIITMLEYDKWSYHWYYKKIQDILGRNVIMKKGICVDVKNGEEYRKVLHIIVDTLYSL
ncbi:hypothetical protein SUGI_0671950 [Cryptomeria japonica]|nr:hypothetical protein SUGI_0671950 [Cryptomeria japonica]